MSRGAAIRRRRKRQQRIDEINRIQESSTFASASLSSQASNINLDRIIQSLSKEDLELLNKRKLGMPKKRGNR
tara:strand:+ start:239 stop:457 length:219 start_codon:yes stop_codon:yes gene_type:complete